MTIFSARVTRRFNKTYLVFLFIEHEGGDGPTSIGAGTGLTTNVDGGTAPTVLILSAGDGTRRHWHDRGDDGRRI